MLNFLNSVISAQILQPQRCECRMLVDDCEKVSVKMPDGANINAWYLHTKRPSAYVITHYGIGGCLCKWAYAAGELRRRHNAAVLAYDYRSHGASTGKADMTKLVTDGEQVTRWLCRRVKCKPADVVMHGFSLGGAVAVQLAVRIKAKALIVESSFSSIRDMTACCLPLGYVLKGLVPDHLNSTAAISHYHGDLLVCHSDADEIVPYSQGRAVFDACPSKHKTFVTMYGLEHTADETPHYVRRQKRFFKSLM